MVLQRHCTENHVFSFQTSWKDGLSKKIALEYDLSCIIGEDDISFFLKYYRKMKDDLSRKDTWKYDIFFKFFEKIVFSKKKKKKALEYDLSCIIWKDESIFFPENMTFFLGGKWKMIFLKKYMDIWYLLYIRIDVTNMMLCPSAKKKKIKDDLLPQRYT